MNLQIFGKRLVKGVFNKAGYDLTKSTSYVRPTLDYKWVANFIYLKELYDTIYNIEGDIVECGVGVGNSLFKLCALASSEGLGRKVYGFDSFEGFPEPSVEDESPRNPQKGQWNVGTAETIKELLTDGYGMHQTFIESQLRLVKGFFEDSLQYYDGNGVAFLHLDVDLYNSYKVTLEYFWPKLKPGGVLLFDEYKQDRALRKFPGAAKAIDEFLGPQASKICYNESVDKYYLIKS